MELKFRKRKLIFGPLNPRENMGLRFKIRINEENGCLKRRPERKASFKNEKCRLGHFKLPFSEII